MIRNKIVFSSLNIYKWTSRIYLVDKDVVGHVNSMDKEQTRTWSDLELWESLRQYLC